MAIQQITGRMIEDGAITVADVADGSITTAKLADGNVTAVKVDTVANTQITGTITDAQIASTFAKLNTAQTWTATQTYGDNVKQQFGDSNDLQIYHSGAHSLIQDAGTGNLIIQGADLTLGSITGETYATFTDNGAATLWYDNASKLATTSTGVSVTGTVAATAYTGDGSGLSGIAGGFSNMQVFTGSGTWTNPGSVTKVKVTVVGGGGGAGGSHPANNYHHSGGGGGGGTAIEVLTIPTSPVPVTVGGGGAGGPSGSNGSTGGTSSFGAYCSATGGAGSVSAAPGPDYRIWYGGAGGAGSGGNLNMNGGNGGPEGMVPVSSGAPDLLANFANGWGGTSYLSAGSSVRRGQAWLTPGVSGLAYGGGGGGCGDRAGGGSGAAGVVIVEY